MVPTLLLGCRLPCPAGSQPAPELEAAAREALAEVAPDLADVPAQVCVGRVEAAVHPGGIVVLDARDLPAERAARLGHLLLHVREGFTLNPGPACLGDAVAAEARALEQEDVWRAGWELPPLPPDAIDTRRAQYARRCNTDEEVR